MIIGCCTNTLPRLNNDVSYEYAEDILKAGFDYIDLPIAQVTALSEGEFKEMLSYLKGVGLPVYACNSFVPTDMVLVGPNLQVQRIRDFYRKALERAGTMGAKHICFGSPWAKNCPDGFAKEDAFNQLKDWFWEIGEEAKQYDLNLALEPVNSRDTNMLTRFDECVDMAKAVNHQNIKCLQDYYQMRMEGDTVDSLLSDGADYLVHTHFATYPKRGFPVSADEDAYYKTYFQALKKIGYDGGISQEGLPISKDTFFEEAVRMRELIRKCWDEASAE